MSDLSYLFDNNNNEKDKGKKRGDEVHSHEGDGKGGIIHLHKMKTNDEEINIIMQVNWS